MKIAILFSFIFSFNAFSLTGVKLGSEAPQIKLRDTEGKEFDLSKLKKSTILVFYRGAWCPYCIKQLISVEKEVFPNLKGEANLLAISVDSQKEAAKMKEKMKLSYSVISDPKAKSLKAFKIINKLDDELVKKYKTSYKIDVEASSGEKHHMVAHPAVFIIKNGKIIYKDVHTDYKERTKNTEILKAL